MTPVGLHRLDHGLLVGLGPLPDEPLMRIPAARHQIGDGDAVGGDRGLRQQSEPPRHLLGLDRVDVGAIENDLPADGFSSRDRPRSRVDLPHAFGPTITVNDSSGIATDRSSLMTRLS